jgi:hypothetical protein
VAGDLKLAYAQFEELETFARFGAHRDEDARKIIPADDKDNARLIVSRIVIDALETLKMSYPKTTAKRRLELKSIRERL